MKDVYEDFDIGFKAQNEYDPQSQEEQQEQEEHKILNAVFNFLNDNGEIICKAVILIILLSAMVTMLKFLTDKITTMETKEEYTTATVVGFDEEQRGNRYHRYKHYYVELDVNGNIITEENEKLYMTSNIGDVYKIKLVGNFNKYDELIDYNILFIEKVEENESY